MAINHIKEFFHDAEEVMTPDLLGDEWNPRRNYKTIFEERISASPSPSSLTAGKQQQQNQPKQRLNPASKSCLRRNNAVTPSNIFLTVDYKDEDHRPIPPPLQSPSKDPIATISSLDTVVLPSSPLDTTSNRDRHSWNRTRASFRHNPFTEAAVQSSSDCGDSSVGGDYWDGRFEEDDGTNAGNDNAAATVVKDLTTLAPIKSRRNVSTPTRGILRRSPMKTTVGGSGNGLSPWGSTSRQTPEEHKSQPQHHLAPKFVSFADVLHTECTICVSPNNLRRSVRRDRSRPRNRTPPLPTSLHPTPPSSCDTLRVLVLLMDPVTRQYELTSIHPPCPADSRLPSPQLGSLLGLLRRATTHEPLRLQHYTGFCRPVDGMEMINGLAMRMQNVTEDEILIAIPAGYDGGKCAALAGPILRNGRFLGLVERLRKRKRTRRRMRREEEGKDAQEMVKMTAKGRRNGWWGSDGGSLSYELGVVFLAVLMPAIFFAWTFTSIGLPEDGSTYHFNNAGVIKLLNALVDDIDTEI